MTLEKQVEVSLVTLETKSREGRKEGDYFKKIKIDGQKVEDK